jgi:hypothetical protein
MDDAGDFVCLGRERKLIALIIAVDLAMRLEIAALGERAGTLLTLIWPLARVSPDVNFKSTRSHERHLTEAAFEWPLTSMPSLVVTEMSMSREDSTAVLE